MATETPFPFLSLPIDIRLLVYESILIETRYYTLKASGRAKNPDAQFVSRTIPLSILATCRVINEEAHGLLLKRASSLNSAEPPRLIVPKGKVLEETFEFFPLIAEMVTRATIISSRSSITEVAGHSRFKKNTLKWLLRRITSHWVESARMEPTIEVCIYATALEGPDCRSIICFVFMLNIILKELGVCFHTRIIPEPPTLLDGREARELVEALDRETAKLGLSRSFEDVFVETDEYRSAWAEGYSY